MSLDRGLMKKPFLFELCAETLEAVQIAQAHGAGRVELCARLDVGGVTPDLSLVKACVQAVDLPVHVLIRPRAGNFVYSTDEFARMEREIAEVYAAGAAGVVLGALQPDDRVDVGGTRRLIELARPMKVTFHRAFDESADLPEALEDVIATGADCLLTSGGADKVLAGAARIAQLRRQARGRIEIMAGGGLKLATLTELVELTGVNAFHGSLKRTGASNGEQKPVGAEWRHLGEDLVQAIRVLETAVVSEPIG